MLRQMDLGKKEVILHKGDITDAYFIANLVAKVEPDEIYNLAAQSHVGDSFECPDHTYQVNTQGLSDICNSVVGANLLKKTKIFHASTSEMFGDGHFDRHAVIDEKSGFFPMSPYAVSKVAAYYWVQYFRRVHNMFICTGLTFNHESPLRHESFVTRKITSHVVKIKHCAKEGPLRLGNIYSMRDWGYAFDYIKGFWQMLNQCKTPQDYIIATE